MSNLPTSFVGFISNYLILDVRFFLIECYMCKQVRKGHLKIYQQDIVDVLDKQLLEGMGVLLTEEEQQKCEQSVRLL